MKLIKLEIADFRQFYGKQVIEFSADPEKGVTLIHGENNGGKTALLNALRWCLYEETTDNLQDPLNLINKHALEKGKHTFHVNIQLVHDNRLLEVMRTGSHTNRTSTLKIYEIKDGNYSERAEKSPNTLINTFLPKEMSQYFFYQGEGTGTLSSQNNFSHIKNAISKVLGLTVAEKTLTHLTRIKNDYQKELTQYDTDNEIEKLVSNKEVLQHKLSKDLQAIDKKKKALEEAEKEFEEQIKLLSRFDKTAIDEKLKLRSQKESVLSSLERQRLNLLDEKVKSVPKWITHAYCRKLGEFDLTSLDTKELNTSLRYTVDKQLLKAILEHHQCICGAKFEDNSPTASLIAELDKSAVDHDLKRRWQKAAELHKKLASYSSPKQQMLNNMSQLDDCEDNIEELKRSIEDLSHTIVDSDIDNIKQIESRKNAAKASCDQLHREIPHLEREIAKTRTDLEDIDSRVMRLSSTQPKAAKVRNLIQATDQIIDLYKEAISSSKENVDMILLNKMQVLFSRVAFNGYTVKKVSSTNDSFTWVIVDNRGNKVAAGNGYQAMLAISFIIALIQFSKERANNKQHLLTPGTIAPFIADSILAFIGPDNGRELVRYIAESVEQSIFMFSQAQWTEEHTDKGIRDRIGKEYNLVQHTVLNEEEFKGSYPTRLSVQGNEFDVVRFGSDFDKVTIEEVVLNG